MGRIAAVLGRPLMPWQQLVVDVGLEVQSEEAGDPAPGEWAYGDLTVTIQRQAGKTTLLRPIVAHRCGTWKQARVFTTAQKREKSRARWMDATDDFLTSPLAKEVRRKTARMGEELRWLSTQSTFVPFAPKDDDMHGETPDLVAVDELWAFDQETAKAVQGAYVPGFATKDAQAWKFSTAGTSASWWLNTARTNGRAAVERDARLGTAFFEWSLPDRVGGKRIKHLSDDELIQACIEHHPAYGYTLRPQSVWLAWDQMGDRSEFLRAYGNRSAEDVAAKWSALTETTWGRQTDPGQIPASARVSLGVWVDEDGGGSAIAAAWRDEAGQMHAEIPQNGQTPTIHDGIRWVRAEVGRISAGNDVATVALPNVGPARDLADELHAAGHHVTRVAQADVAAACVRHRSELEAGTWWHRLSTETTDAAAVASWERSRWGEPSDSIAPLGAQTMAGWGVDHAPAPPPPVTRFKIR